MQHNSHFAAMCDETRLFYLFPGHFLVPAFGCRFHYFHGIRNYGNPGNVDLKLFYASLGLGLGLGLGLLCILSDWPKLAKTYIG